MFHQFLIVPMFSALTDPADNRAPLASLPLCHPHLCKTVTSTLQTTTM